ncbi:MAG: hypothetical protein GY856_14005, partial [bacterium]|nr:hypothetical protein [bacterium]
MPKEFDPAVFREVLAYLYRYHDALRVRFVGDGPRRRQQIDPPGGPIRFHGVDLSRLAGERRQSALERAASQVREQLEIERGPLHCCCWFDLGRAAADRLLILVHHLVLDAASFQLFLADLWTAYQQRLAGQPTDL